MPRLFEKKKHYRVRTSVAIAVCMQENLRWLCAPIKGFLNCQQYRYLDLYLYGLGYDFLSSSFRKQNKNKMLRFFFVLLFYCECAILD
jgi:hypothetical protein